MATLVHFAKLDWTVRNNTTATAAEVSNYTVAWSDLTTAGFANGDTAIVLVMLKNGIASANANNNIQVGVGTTYAGRADITISKARNEPSSSGTYNNLPYLFLDQRTLVTNENFYISMWGDGTNQSSADDYGIYFLKVGGTNGLGANDLVYAENTPTGDAPTTYDTGGASISTPAAGDWLFIAHTHWLVDSTTADGFMAIDVNGSDLSEVRTEGEDTGDEWSFGTLAYSASLGSGVTVRVRYRTDSATTHDCNGTAIVGIRLNAFLNSAGTQTANTITHSVVDTYQEAWGPSFSLTNTGPVMALFYGIHDWNTASTPEATKVPYGRIQLGGSDWPEASANRTGTRDNGANAIGGPILHGYSASVSSGSPDFDFDVAEDGDVAPTYACDVQTGALFSLELAPTGTDTSDQQPSYIRGTSTAADQQPSYIRGTLNISDQQPSYVRGVDTATDQQPSYIRGTADAVDQQPAYIMGALGSSAQQAAYISGVSIGESDQQPAYIRGTDTLADQQSAYIRGSDTSTDQQPAYIRGVTTTLDQQSAYIRGVIEGSAVWGHDTSVSEDNVRNFTVNWTGSGFTAGAGDKETIVMLPGQVMDSEVIKTGAISIALSQNKYTAGADAILKYRTAANQTNLDAASWVVYEGDFTSLGYVQLRLDNSMPLAVNGTDARRLVNEHGNPVLIVGDAGWSLISDLNTTDIHIYLEDRKSRGFNAILVLVIDHLFCTNAPNNIFNDPPFTGANFTTPNEVYFAHLDYALRKADSLDMYLLLYPLYLGFPSTEEGWDTEVAAASTNDMRLWGEYLGARYKNFNNIIWVIGGDRDPTTPTDFSAKLDAFVYGLRTYDKRHLVTTHNERGSAGFDYISQLEWQTLNNSYSTYLNTPSEAQNAYADTPTTPHIQIEGYYENEHSMTAQNLRAQAYWSVLEGSCGHVFGNNPIWAFTYLDSAWKNFLDDAGSQGMTRFKNFFTAVAWQNLVPDTAHDLLTVGYGTLGNADYAGAAIDAGGTLAVIYMPSNRTMTVDMSLFADTVTARWYDPTNGSYTDDAASPLANSGTHNFSRAAANSAGDADWVLILEA